MNIEHGRKNRQRRALRRLSALSLPAVRREESAALQFRSPLSARVLRSQPGSDAWEMRTECLVSGSAADHDRSQSAVPANGQTRQDWQEGRSGMSTCPPVGWHRLRRSRSGMRFTFRSARCRGTVVGKTRRGTGTGRLADRRRSLQGHAERSKPRDAWKMRTSQAGIEVLAAVPGFRSQHSACRGRRVCLACSIRPEQFKAAAAGCQNVGTWPVLAGEEGQRNLMLSAPIILYDYPQIAPESPGDLSTARKSMRFWRCGS